MLIFLVYSLARWWATKLAAYFALTRESVASERLAILVDDIWDPICHRSCLQLPLHLPRAGTPPLLVIEHALYTTLLCVHPVVVIAAAPPAAPPRPC